MGFCLLHIYVPPAALGSHYAGVQFLPELDAGMGSRDKILTPQSSESTWGEKHLTSPLIVLNSPH